MVATPGLPPTATDVNDYIARAGPIKSPPRRPGRANPDDGAGAAVPDDGPADCDLGGERAEAVSLHGHAGLLGLAAVAGRQLLGAGGAPRDLLLQPVRRPQLLGREVPGRQQHPGRPG